MHKHNDDEIKNSYTNDKNKPQVNTFSIGKNEMTVINDFRSSKNIRKELSLQCCKTCHEVNSKNNKEKNIMIKSSYTNKKKNIAKSNNKKENLGSFSDKNIFKNLLNECLLNITQQANRKNMIIDNNITKADKKFLKEYKLNYLNSQARSFKSSSLGNNVKSNTSSDNKNNNKIRKSPFHKSNSLKKNDFKSINLVYASPQSTLNNDHLKIQVVNYDNNNIKSFTNKRSNSIKFSTICSKDSLSLKNKSIINLSKKSENKKSSKKIIEYYKNNSNVCHSTKNLNKYAKEKSKIKPLNSIGQIKFKNNKNPSFPDSIILESKKKLSIPEYINHSSIINKEDILNLPFLNNNLTNEELGISTNLKQNIKKNISGFKSSSPESSFEYEGANNNLRKKNGTFNIKVNKIKNSTSNKEELNSVVEKNEIKKKRSSRRSSKITNKNKHNRKIKETVNIDKKYKSQDNLVLENSNTLKILNDKKIIPDNVSIQTSNSNNTITNENISSQIVLLNKNIQKSNDAFTENESKIGKINNNVMLRKVNSKSSRSIIKYSTRLEVFRNLTKKNIIYDSLDDEEIDEFDENILSLSPNSFYVIFFDVYIALSSIIFMISIPLNLARNRQFCINSMFCFKYYLIYITEVIYFIDVLMGFFKMYYNFEEQLIDDHSKIVNHYLKGFFALDLICASPLLSINIFTTPKCNIHNKIKLTHKYYDCKLNDLIDLWKLIKLIKIVKILNDNFVIRFFYKCIDEFDINENIITFIAYLCIVGNSLHFATCLNIFISRNSYPNWIFSLNMQNKSFLEIYLTSLYHIVTSLTTVGYGDITPNTLIENIFQLIILLIGIVAYSWLVSSFSNYIKINNEKYIEYENKVKILEDIKLKNPKIPDNLYMKIFKHLRYGKKKGKIDYDIIFEILPYSLKNLLIYEMYKPIINNFTFFKDSQNSDFIIKTIMAFRPFSAAKNDFIVKFGDILEEMIFVKRGKLSIEISINKKFQKQLIESYLSDKLFHNDKIFLSIQKKKRDSSIILNNLNNAIFNNKNSNNTTKNSSIFPYKIDLNSINKSSIFELDEYPLKNDTLDKTKEETNLRIVDIRQNEYFGDILMFLGYKSPINIRVKSKEVELFLLKKVDAINISLTYKNIWNKINEKSTFNIEQIKFQIQKVVKQYCQSKGIKIKNNKIKKKSNKKAKLKPQKSTNIDESNENNDNSVIISNIFNTAISNSERIKASQNTIYSIIDKIDDEKDKNNKNRKKSNFANNKKETIEKLKNSSSIDFESSLKENKASNIIEDYKNSNLFKLSNKFYENSSVKSDENQNYIRIVSSHGKNDSNTSNDEKNLSSNQYSNSNDDKNGLTPFKPEEVNDEIYPGEIFQVDINENLNDKKDFFSFNKIKKNYPFHEEDDLKKNNFREKKTKENDSNEKKSKNIKVKYSNNTLMEIKNFSLEYKSIYDNINQFTKYQYSKDNELQLKTKIFLEDICFNKEKIEESSNIEMNTKKTKINNDTNEIKNIKEFFKDDSYVINKKFVNTKISSNPNKLLGNNINIVKNSNNDEPNIQKNVNNSSTHSIKRRSSVCFSAKKVNKLNNNDSIDSLKRRTTFRKSCQRFSLFAKHNNLNNNNLSVLSQKKTKKINKSNQLLLMVNKNIIQDSQNINNPEMFYSDLFSNLMKKTKRSEISENKGTENLNNLNVILEDNQKDEHSFVNNKEKTFSNFDFSPLRQGELSPKIKKTRKSKKFTKGYLKNSIEYSNEIK